jgi:hypothetical protein
MAERAPITCPACGRVYSSAVRGDDTHCPDPDCRANVYVRLDGTYRGQGSPAAAVADVGLGPGAELGDDQGDDQGDVDQLEAEPAAAVASAEDLEDGRGGVDLVPWLCGLVIVGGVAWAWWAQRRERPAPAAAVPVYGGLGWSR